MSDFGEDLKKIVLAGIGAVAISAEKANEVIEELIKKGEITLEQGKVLNEELKHNIQDKVKEKINVNIYKQNSLLDDLDKLSAEELAELKNRLAAMEQEQPNDKEDEQ